MSAVEFVNVTKVYGRDQRAVDRVSLAIEDGELLVLVGPSGCGKSTLLRMLAGLEDVTEGEVKIGGRVVNDVAPRDRDVAMVFQNYALYPHMSVYDNMAFGLRRRKFAAPEVDRRVRETAALLGIEGYLTRKPRELSGGERQRVALGRAMVRDPKLFLFDEPLSNLDAKLRVHMRAEIKRLHHRVKSTMIYVTHDQVEAMTLGDRIAVLKKGVIQQVADPFTLYTRPANQFVAAFIGSPPINLFGATVSASGSAVEAGGINIPLPASVASRLEPLRGKPVVLGVRPEDLSLQPVAAGGTITGTVEVSEPLGSEVLVHWSTPVGVLISRVPGQKTLAPGEAGKLHFDFAKLHVFDPATEQALDGVPATV